LSARGLKLVRDGKKYVSMSIQKRIDKRNNYPDAAGELTAQETEITRLICAGFKKKEIADTLHISERTVENHKKEIYRVLNVRNSFELYNAAHNLGIVSHDWQDVYPKDFEVRPLPEKKRK